MTARRAPETGMPGTAAKREHLRKMTAEHPEYGEILDVFQRLFACVEGNEGRTGISFEAEACRRAERVRAGFPLIAPENVRVDPAETVPWLKAILGVMRSVGKEGKGELDKIERALDEGALDLGALFAACLGRERSVVDEAAGRISAPSPLLEFLLGVALKTSLERFAETVEPELLADWKEGFCPVCGSRAGMDELVGEEGKRYLSCSGCFFRWPFKRVKCPYCGNEDADTLSYFTAGEGPTRVGVCRKCSRYIKTRDSRKGHADVPLEVEDLATLHLDLLAGKEGFERGK